MIVEIKVGSYELLFDEKIFKAINKILEYIFKLIALLI